MRSENRRNQKILLGIINLSKSVRSHWMDSDPCEPFPIDWVEFRVSLSMAFDFTLQSHIFEP